MHSMFAFGVGSCALVASAAAQVTFAPVLPAQPLRYEVTADYSLRRGPAPDAAGTVLKQSATLRFEAAERQPAEGLGLRMSIEKLRVELTVHDSIAPEGKVTLLEWDGAGEVAVPEGAPAAFAAYPKLVASGAELRLRADGTVEAITGAEAAFAGSRPGSRGAFLGSFGPEGMVALVESLFAVDPDLRARSVGDSWRVMEGIQFSTSRLALATTTMKVTGIEGDVAKLAGEFSVEVRPPKGVPDAADPSMAVLEQKGSVSAAWDTKAGRLVSRDGERYLVWEVRLETGGTPMMMKDYTSSRTTARLVGK